TRAALRFSSRASLPAPRADRRVALVGLVTPAAMPQLPLRLQILTSVRRLPAPAPRCVHQAARRVHFPLTFPQNSPALVRVSMRHLARENEPSARPAAARSG